MVRNFKDTDISSVRKIWVDSHIRQDGFISTDMWRTGLITLNKSVEETDVYVCVEHGSVCGFIQLDCTEIVGLFCAYDRHFKKIISQLLEYVKNISSYLVFKPFMTDSESLKIYSHEGFKKSSEHDGLYVYSRDNI